MKGFFHLMLKCFILFTLFFSLICIQYIPTAIGSDVSIETNRNSSDILSNSLITISKREIVVRLKSGYVFSDFHKFCIQLEAESVFPIFSPTTPAGQHPLLSRYYLVRFPKTSQFEHLQQKFLENHKIEATETNRLNRFCSDITPTDPRHDEQWNLKAMNMPKAWNLEQGEESVVIAVVDSGIMLEHPELRNQLWLNSGEIVDNGVDDDRNGYIDDIIGWDFTDAPTFQGLGDWKDRDNMPNDETGHGTQVSGIIAAEANNGIGISGIAWNCKLMTLRAGFRIGAGAFLQNDDIAAAIVYAADNRADVINMSLGDTVNAFLIQDAVDYAYKRGCVLVAAAGNSSEPGSYYPAALENVLSVAALDSDNQLGSSNFGASIDVAAPGEEILTTDLSQGYGFKSGTSMAAAHISGVAALLISANPSCSNEQVYQWIKDSARQLSIANLVGAGLVDANAALITNNGLLAEITARFSQHVETSERNTIINISGSAGGIDFQQYWLEYGITETPDLWFPIGFPQTIPKHNDILHQWETSELNEGIYTIRLSVQSKNDNIIRDKTVIEIRNTLPQISKHEASQWLSGNQYDSTIIWQTDALTIGSIELFHRTDKQTLVRMGYSESVSRQHVIHLSEMGLPSGEYLYRLTTQNRGGLIKIEDNNGNLYPISVINEQIQPSHLIEKTSIQHGLHAIVTPYNLNGNSKKEIIGVETGTSIVHIYEADTLGVLNKTITIDIDQPISRIWSSADTDGDGLIELLCNSGKTTFLLEQAAPGEPPSENIWNEEGIWGGTIVDIDLDGIPEIYSRHDDTDSIHVYESNGDNSYNNIASLQNPTRGTNNLPTRFATGDFDSDGRVELLTGDSDGELFIYENVGDNIYQHTWTDTLIDGIPQIFAAGDMDGDKIPEFVVGSKVWTTELDLPRQHWLITIYTSSGNDSYRAVWHQRIRELHDGENGITIADANNDSRNELCIVVPPNCYLIQYDGTTYKPIWYHPATSTFNSIVADIDNDGNNELMFNYDNQYTVFYSPYNTGIQSNITPPWGLTAQPLDETTISLKWQSDVQSQIFTILRGMTKTSMKPIKRGIKEKQYTDMGLISGQTYWYAIISQTSDGNISTPSKPVFVVPTSRPQLISAVHSPLNQVLIKFNKAMNIEAANASRYLLHRFAKLNRSDDSNTESFAPQSAIFDQTQKRVVLTFASGILTSEYQYEIEAIQLSDIYGAALTEESRIASVEYQSQPSNEIIVYPNPSRGDQVTFDRLTADSKIDIYDVTGNRVISLSPNEQGTTVNRCKSIWTLDGVSSGVYIYVIDNEKGRNIGKISIIR